MKRAWNIWVTGGDLRQATLAELLARDGHSVHTWAMERAEEREELSNLRREDSLAGMEEADLVILPLPVLNGDGMLNAQLSETV